MKKGFWNKFGEGVLEVIVEVVAVLILGGLGLLLLSLFGVTPEMLADNTDLAVLVGIAALIILLLPIYLIVKWIKSR